MAKSSRVDDKTGLTPRLDQVWVHAHEEDSDGTEVYRPRGWKFLPSRGRNELDLRPSTSSRQLPGEDDSALSYSGKWRHDPEAGTIEFAGPHFPVVFEIVEHAADKLVLRRRN
jgi:hypothetical protein